jgi:hypothetical protein
MTPGSNICTTEDPMRAPESRNRPLYILESAFYIGLGLAVLIATMLTGSATPLLLLAMCLVAGSLVYYSRRPPTGRNR